MSDMRLWFGVAAVLAVIAGIFWLIRPPTPVPAGDLPPFRPQLITLETDPETRDFRLAKESLVFVDPAGKQWVAPVGTKTDGASIPTIFLSLAGDRFEREYLNAAVVHDAYCDRRNQGQVSYQTRPWREVHRMFFEALIAGGAAPAKAKLMYAAVWMGGPRWESQTGQPLARPSDADLQQQFLACVQYFDGKDMSPTAGPPLEGEPTGSGGPLKSVKIHEEPTLDQLDSWMEQRDPWTNPEQR